MSSDEPSRRIDLGGLQVFEAVMREGNVTRAAERLALTQSAVSHALARLRHIFNDPLFVKTASGVRPTRRAQELWSEVEEPLRALRRSVFPTHFDPATADFAVSLAVNDMITQQVLTPWLARLRRIAPGLRLSLVMRIYGDSEARLQEGTLDFGLGLFSSLPTGLRRREVWSDRYVCVFGRENPLAQAPWTLQAFQSAAHVRVFPNGERFSLADVGLRLTGIQSHIAMLVSHFSSVPGLLQATDLVALMPRFYAIAKAESHGLAIRDLPFAADPVRYELVWHERAELSPALNWFREELLREVRVAHRKPANADHHDSDS